jgi:hypothetical protein
VNETHPRLVLALALFAMFLLCFGVSIVSAIANAYAFLPRTGKVIDGATGKGIPNIPVIASAYFRGTGLMGTGYQEDRYRVITYTDSDGVYHIPGQWRFLSFELPLPLDYHTGWTIVAFKIGYAIVGDDDALRPDAAGVITPNSTWFSPKATFGFPEAHVAPIVMRTVNLSDSEATWYYANLISLFAVKNPMAPEELALRRIGYDYFAPRICSMDPQQPLTWVAGDFVDDGAKYDTTIMKIQEDADKKTPGTGKFVARLAGSECAALRAGEEDRK